MEDKNENKMQLIMEQRIFIVKSYYETKSYNQVQTKFRTLFPERLPPNKTRIWENVKKYKRDDISLNMNKGRSGRRITTRWQEAVWSGTASKIDSMNNNWMQLIEIK